MLISSINMPSLIIGSLLENHLFVKMLFKCYIVKISCYNINSLQWYLVDASILLTFITINLYFVRHCKQHLCTELPQINAALFVKYLRKKMTHALVYSTCLDADSFAVLWFIYFSQGKWVEDGLVHIVL